MLDFGLVQDGAGVLCIDDATLEIVPNSMATTELVQRARALVNSDFEATPNMNQRAISGGEVDGTADVDFDATIDHDEHHGGKASARFAPRVAEPRGRAALEQDIDSVAFRGKRVRGEVGWLKGRYISTRRNVSRARAIRRCHPDSCALSGDACPFDGTFDWRRCEVVIDMRFAGDMITVSVALEGKGTVWIDNARPEEVSTDIPPTFVDTRRHVLENADFEIAKPDGAPRDWFISGGARAHDDVIVDHAKKHGGSASGRFGAACADLAGYGTMSVCAVDVRGTRLRMTAYVKGQGSTGGATCGCACRPWTRPAMAPAWAVATKHSKAISIGAQSPSSSTCPNAPTRSKWAWASATRNHLVRRRALRAGRRLGSTHGPPQGPHHHRRGRLRRHRASQRLVHVGGAAAEFRSSIDHDEHAPSASGTSSLKLTTNGAFPSGYGTYMTSFLAESHRKKRLRMSAQVKGNGIEGRGDVWLRVQSKTSPSDGPGLGGRFGQTTRNVRVEAVHDRLRRSRPRRRDSNGRRLGRPGKRVAR